MLRNAYRSPEFRQKRARKIKLVSIFSTIFFLALVTGLVFLLRMEKIQIREVNISGTKILEADKIKEDTNASLSGAYVWLIPKSNTFLYSKALLAHTLSERFPVIKNITIKRQGFNTLDITIEERKPHALWCQNPTEGSTPQCFFVDDTGFVFSPSAYFSGNVYFIYHTEVPAEKAIGTSILPEGEFETFEKFVATLEKVGLDISSAEFKDPLDYDLLLTSGTRMMLSRKISYEDAYRNIVSLLKNKEHPVSFPTLEYIDLRFGNKVYLREKSKEVAKVSATSTATSTSGTSTKPQ